MDIIKTKSLLYFLGKRNAMSWEYDATVNSTNGQILSFEVTITEDYGCSLNNIFWFFFACNGI